MVVKAYPRNLSTRISSYLPPTTNMAMGKSPFLIGDTSSNSLFSIVMLVLRGVKVHSIHKVGPQNHVIGRGPLHSTDRGGKKTSYPF